MESEDEAEVDAGNGVGQEVDRHDVQNVIASSDEDEMRVEVEKQLNGNGARTRGQANGRTQQKGKPSSSSSKQQQKSSQKIIEVPASGEEENVEEDVIHIDVPPPRESRTGKAVEKSGRSSRQPKRRKEESSMNVDEVLEGQDGIAALIDKIGQPGVANGRAPVASEGSSGVKNAQLVRLKEKISRVSNAPIPSVHDISELTQLIQLENENKTLSNQMEELFRVRETEAEALMQRSEEQYEAKIRGISGTQFTELQNLTYPLNSFGRS